MTSWLTEDEENKTKEFVEKANFIRHKWNAGPIPWTAAVKFLMARKFDVGRALDLYQSHEATRAREGLIHIEPYKPPLSAELETGKFTILPTRDCNGAAIALLTARLHIPQLSTHQSVLQSVVYQLDCALESIETQRNGLVFLYDMSGSKYNNFDYELSTKILTMLKGAYPARLKKVLIVGAPLWFKAPFNILRLFVRQKLRDRVHLVSVPELILHIPRTSLPREHCGQVVVDHGTWLRSCSQAYSTQAEGVYADITPFISSLNSPSPVETVVPPLEISEEKSSPQKETPSTTLPNGAISTQDIVTLAANNGLTTAGEESGAAYCTKDSVHQEDTDHGQSIDQFVEFLREKGRQGLIRDYMTIKSSPPDGTFDASRQRTNLSKNRYTDVLCVDKTRVHLSGEHDYINANHVDGYKQKGAFISTQGPLPRTFEDFWRMIWEQQTITIVMTTRTVERGRVKCGQYWPTEEGTDEQYGRFTVTNISSRPCRDYVVTTLRLTNTLEQSSGDSGGGGDSDGGGGGGGSPRSADRLVHHFQFTSWPDYGVPTSAQAMLDFLSNVRQHQSSVMSAGGAHCGGQWRGHPAGPPIVVHCSAGIGRTGTFITLDTCIQRLHDVGKVSVEKTVRAIRSQRAFSIQMPDQYVFCHLALVEHALMQGLLGDVDLAGFDDSEEESDE